MIARTLTLCNNNTEISTEEEQFSGTFSTYDNFQISDVCRSLKIK